MKTQGYNQEKPSAAMYYNYRDVFTHTHLKGSPRGASSKEPSCQSRRRRHKFSAGVWEVLWRRVWQPPQPSCLENPEDRGAWGATVRAVAERRTRLK